MPCVGAGQIRYKFHVQTTTQEGRTSTPSTDSEGADQQVDAMTLLAGPTNELTVLSSTLVAAIKPSTHLRYNLAWTYGNFLDHIPSRLGRNAALDAAVTTLCAGHADLQMHLPEVSRRTRNIYGSALATLREYLNDEVKARTTETLCAVYILLVCQVFTGDTGKHITHTEGAIRLLRARGSAKLDDVFERDLLLTLRGPVMFEALFNPRLRLSDQELRSILVQQDVNWYNQFLFYIADIPALMHRVRDVKDGVCLDSMVFDDVRYRYEASRSTLSIALTKLKEHEAVGVDEKNELLHLNLQRIYGMTLFVTILLNCLYSVLDPTQAQLVVESETYARDICTLADQSHKYRPLGSSYIAICLIAAYAGASDPGTRAGVLRTLSDYCGDFPWMTDNTCFQYIEHSALLFRLQNSDMPHLLSV